jgi:excisionase family DNA binding protein
MKVFLFGVMPVMWYDVKSCEITLNRSFSMMRKGYLTVEQVAGELSLTEYRVRELIREKQIRATKIGKWWIKPEDLEEFIKARTNK